VDSSSCTRNTRRVIYEEWEVPPPLVATVVLLLKSEEWTVPLPLLPPIVLLLKSGKFLLH
jgi:hypothetical protein